MYLNRDDKTYLEPDIILVCDPGKMKEKGCYGASDFVAEIVSPSTQSRDYFLKLNKYQDAGVKEYWILDIRRDTIHMISLAGPKRHMDLKKRSDWGFRKVWRWIFQNWSNREGTDGRWSKACVYRDSRGRL